MFSCILVVLWLIWPRYRSATLSHLPHALQAHDLVKYPILCALILASQFPGLFLVSMSYSQLPALPPAYGQPEVPRQSGDNIPDDFKYSVTVASCELPIRQLFLRKVYSLLTMQLAATLVVGYIIKLSESIQAWSFNNMWLFYVAMFGTFGFMLATYFKARSYPTNLILLAGFTLCEAYTIGLACSLVQGDILVQAILITLLVFIGLTAFAFQTKYDFTSWQGFLSVGLWALICWGFVMMFIPSQSKGVQMIYSGIGAVVFSGYVLVDTQMIMKTAFLDDEIPATITLYLDILNLFLFILRFLQSTNDD